MGKDPVRSMTGAGTFVVDGATGRIEAEARSVNHRYLKTSVRVQGPLPTVTPIVEAALKRHVRRGHITVHLSWRPHDGTDAAAHVDAGAFARAAARLRELAEEHGLGPVTTSDVLLVPGVIAEQIGPADEEAQRADLEQAAEGVAAALREAREREGAALAAEVDALLAGVTEAMAGLARRADEVPAAVRERLQKRMGDLLEGTGVPVDPAQVTREAALLADKADVREEITRVGSHVEHARALLAEGGPVGRRLDFLAQELHREANTIASKAADLEIGATVLELRAGIERMREQVQNLE